MKKSNIAGIAVAWFRADEWHELKTLCPDLQNTYEEWLRNAEAGIDALGPLENPVEKVILTIDQLRDWKRATGRKIDSKVRAQLAIMDLQKRSATRH